MRTACACPAYDRGALELDGALQMLERRRVCALRGTVTLVNAARSDKTAVSRDQIRVAERRYGDVVREELNLQPSALTRSEAEYILDFRDADGL